MLQSLRLLLAVTIIVRLIMAMSVHNGGVRRLLHVLCQRLIVLVEMVVVVLIMAIPALATTMKLLELYLVLAI